MDPNAMQQEGQSSEELLYYVNPELNKDSEKGEHPVL